MIVYEVLDKIVDIATAVEYFKGRLFYETKESVYEALLAFVIIGGIISILRISLYVWRIVLNYRDDEDERHEKRYDDLDIGIHIAKVVLEAFPQSVIAKFYFVHCPIKKYGWDIKILDPAFDSFCGAPFFFFWISLCCYCCKHSLRNKVCVPVTLIITFAISVAGFVFAVLSIAEFANRCS